MASGNGGGKNKKYGRMSAWCKAYAGTGTRLRNKARNLLRQIKFARKKGSVDTFAESEYKKQTGKEYTA